VDLALPDPNNVTRGVLYMGADHIDVIRVSFPIRHPVVDGELPPEVDEHFRLRLEMAAVAGDKPFSTLPDTEAGVPPWYKEGDEVHPERWVQLIAASQRKYGKTMETIEPFNEGDYGWGQGSPQNLYEILGLMRASPEFDAVRLSGPSTLNSDAGLPWYNVIKSRIDRSGTHALGGNMESYINFYKQVVADGKVADNSEAHNLVEVIAGAEYGLQSATWWRNAELARGEFVRAVKGERLAHAEDRLRWTAAAVYRAPDGKVQAFLGSSERQGQTSTYRFVSEDRPVFFNGDGPRREYSATIRNDRELVIDITWGQDVQPRVGGRYVIANRQTGKVLGVAGADTADGAGIRQMEYTGEAHQQWDIAPISTRYHDQSSFTVRAVHSGKSLDNADWSHEEGNGIQQWGQGDAAPQHWYFDYAGDNNFYVRNRWSTKGIVPATDAPDMTIVQSAHLRDERQQWRLIPADSLGNRVIHFAAPRRPTSQKASVQPLSVTLEWDPKPDANIAGYTVFRSTVSGGPYDTIAREVTGGTFIDHEATEPQPCGRHPHFVRERSYKQLRQGRINAVAMGKAAAGEADESGLQIGESLRQVGSKAIRPVPKCLLREEGNDIQGNSPSRHPKEDEPRRGMRAGGDNRPLHPGPIVTANLKGAFTENLALRRFQADSHRHRAALDSRPAPALIHVKLSGKNGKPITLTFAKRDAAIPGIHQTDALPHVVNVEHNVFGIIRVQRNGLLDRHGAPAASSPEELPAGEGIPRKTSGFLVSKCPILDQFRVETTVSRMVGVFKEDAKQTRADGLSLL
jgi:hypothetical protein